MPNAPTLACLLAPGLEAPARAAYVISVIGSHGAEAMHVANDGSVVGAETLPSQAAFVYRDGVGTVLGGPPDSIGSVAHGANSSGLIVGSASYDARSAAIVFDNPGFTALPPVPGYTSQASAISVNEAGQIVGTAGNATGELRAFLYDSGLMINLGTLAGGNSSLATGVNKLGHVVGASGTGQDTFAFLYKAGAMTSLGTLPGYTTSYATGVNDQDVVVGLVNNASNYYAPFIYKNGIMRLLKRMNSDEYGAANAVNNHGDVVGFTSCTPKNTWRGFLFSHGVLTSLNQLPEVKAAGWKSLAPQSIDDQGRIVGIGVRGKYLQSFIMVPQAAKAAVIPRKERVAARTAKGAWPFEGAGGRP